MIALYIVVAIIMFFVVFFIAVEMEDQPVPRSVAGALLAAWLWPVVILIYGIKSLAELTRRTW